MLDPATKALLILILAYLVGSIPFGYLVGWAMGGVDIREHGSGNIGATNVWRTLGPGPGMMTLLFDFSKGLLPVTMALWTVRLDEFGNNGFLWATVICLVGLGSILGHAYPVWFLFQGGKIVATGLGVMVAIAGPWMLIPIGVFGLTLLVTRYVSLSSICGAITVPVLFVMGGTGRFHVFPRSDDPGNRVFIIFSMVAALVVILKHRGNIQRLLTGTEPRIGRPPPPAEAAPPLTPGSAGHG